MYILPLEVKERIILKHLLDNLDATPEQVFQVFLENAKSFHSKQNF